MERLFVEDHPLLDLRAFVAEFSQTLGERSSPAGLLQLLSLNAVAPLQSSDEVRLAVRDLLRHGGFKPTGRNKPASEYLIKAVSDGLLSTVNVAVDACNAVSLHSGLPISVIDIDRARGPFRVGVAPPDSQYVFNRTGQVIRLDGLLCLFDAEGPSANAVKDSQRTKTGPGTRRTLSLVWGTSALTNRAAETEAWYHSLLSACDANVQSIWP